MAANFLNVLILVFFLFWIIACGGREGYSYRLRKQTLQVWHQKPRFRTLASRAYTPVCRHVVVNALGKTCGVKSLQAVKRLPILQLLC